MAVASVKGATQNLIRTSVPNLISGVSQQADALKLASQAVEQINGVSSVVDGLNKRYSTNLVSVLNFNQAGSSPSYPYAFDGTNSGKAIYPKEELFYPFTIEISENEKYLGCLSRLIYDYNFDGDELYDFNLKIFDTAGNAKYVIYRNADKNVFKKFLRYDSTTTENQGYYFNTDKNKYKNLSIADFTFLLNNDKVVKMASDVTSKATTQLAGGTQVNQGLIVVKTGYTGNDRQRPSGQISWSVKIVGSASGVVFASATGTSTEWNPNSELLGGTPSVIATSIATKLNAGVVAGSGWTGGNIASNGYVVAIQHPTQDFKIVVDDGYSGTLFYSVKDNVQNFSDLPLIAPHRFKTTIVGLPTEEGDEYYVEHTSNSTGATEYTGGGSSTNPLGIFALNEGTWSESVASGIKYKLNPDTLPHCIVKLSNDTFLFTPLDGHTATYTLGEGGTKEFVCPSWGDRKIGDLETNPDPDFVDNKINNLFFYKNRLGLLSKESVCLSEASDFFNFFKTAVSQVLDSDPIILTSNSNKIGELFHAVPFYDRVVLFSDNCQFSLQSDGELTAKSASLQPSTFFPVSTTCAPVASKNKMYFASNENTFSSIYEYFINPNTILLDGLNISSNIPNYIPSFVTNLYLTNNYDFIFCKSSGSDNELFVYKYFNSGDEKIQSAWSRWSLPKNNKILHCWFKSSTFFVLTERNEDVTTNYCLFSMNLEEPLSTLKMDSLRDLVNTDGVGKTPFSNADGNFTILNFTRDYLFPLSPAKTLTSTTFWKKAGAGGSVANNLYDKLFTFKSTSPVTTGFNIPVSPSRVYSPKVALATTATQSLSLNQGFDFSIILNKNKNLVLKRLADLEFRTTQANTSITMTLWYSQDNTNFTSLGSVTANSNSTFTNIQNLSFSPLELKSDLSGEKTHYFKYTFHSATNQSIELNFYGLAFEYVDYDASEYFNISELGTTGILFNKSPYKVITANNKVYDTYYVYYNLSNAVSAPVSGNIKYVAHDKLLVKESDSSIIASARYIGIPYPFVYELSNPILKTKSGRGESAVIDGRLQIKNGILLFSNSQFFQVVVSPKFRDAYNYTYLYNFIPNYIGVSPTNLDVIKSKTGSFLFPVYCKSDEVKVLLLNNSVFNCCLLGLEWEALYNARSKRIG
jgi:hypothetical protein